MVKCDLGKTLNRFKYIETDIITDFIMEIHITIKIKSVFATQLK